MFFQYQQSYDISQDLSLNKAQLQSLTLLNMCNQDLKDYLDELTLENPMLEKNSDSQKHEQDFADWYTAQSYRTFQNRKDSGTPLIYTDTFRELSYSQEDSLESMILEQLPSDRISEEMLSCFRYLIHNLDENGFLTFSAEELAQTSEFSRELLTECIAQARRLEPAGIFTSDIRECLILQLTRQGNSGEKTENIIRNHFSDLICGKWGKVGKECGVSTKKIQELMTHLSDCSPYPLAAFGSHKASYIIPDIICAKENDGWRTIANDRWVDNYALSDYYLRMMFQTKEQELKQYLRKKYQQIKMVRTNIDQRRETLLRITEKILLFQTEYFNGGPIKPMTMQQMADELELNVSTVSRAINEKYLQYPGGTIAMKAFFNTGMQKNIFAPIYSEDEITTVIREKIIAEDPLHPLSDADLERILGEEGISVSRRTIAKYRQNAGILSSYQRKALSV